MRHSMLLPAALAMLMASQVAQADPRPTPAVTCKAGGLAAHPKFTQISPGRAEYSFSGICTTRDGRDLGYRLSATWTPSETSFPNANASEIWHITMLSGPSESYDVVLGASCRADPWLNDAPCKRVGDNLSDALRELWPELGADLFPYSRYMIPRDQRAALIAEYDRANGKFDRSQRLTHSVRAEAANRYGGAIQAGGQPTDRVGAGIDEVALNPQPLPPGPGPDPDRVQRAQQAAGEDRAAQAGIIIVSGKHSGQPGGAGETNMVKVQSVVSDRARAVQATTGMLSAMEEANRKIVNNLGDGGDAGAPAAKPDPPICAPARSARARNSPAAPGLERQCIAAGGTL